MTITLGDEDFARFFRKSILEVPMKPFFEEVGEILDSSIQDSFRQGGRYSGNPDEFRGGSQKWTKSKRAEEQSGQTLLDKGQLAASITYFANDAGVIIGSNRVYGAIHHFGGQTGRDHAVTLPARPWLVVQEEDYEDIREALRIHYERFFSAQA